MPEIAQMLARSPKPHRSRVRFQTKKTHWSSRLRPGHWVDNPIPLKTSLLKKKKLKLNSQPDRCLGFRPAMVRDYWEWRKMVFKAKVHNLL